jgi:hypothetical protein
MCSISSSPCSRQNRSRNAIMSRNFHVVFTCRSGKGRRPGWKAFWASLTMTDESFPME